MNKFILLIVSFVTFTFVLTMEKQSRVTNSDISGIKLGHGKTIKEQRKQLVAKRFKTL